MLSAIEIYSERVISHGFKASRRMDDRRSIVFYYRYIILRVRYIKTLQSQFGSNKSRCI